MTDQPDPNNTLWHALLGAQMVVEAVPLDGKMRGGISYAKHEDLLMASRRALHPFGLALTPTISSVKLEESSSSKELIDRRTGETKLIEQTHHVVVHDQAWLLVHAPSGESHEIQTQGLADVRGGNVAQAHVVATTYCLRETLRVLLLLPRGDGDPERQPEPTRRRSQATPAESHRAAQYAAQPPVVAPPAPAMTTYTTSPTPAEPAQERQRYQTAPAEPAAPSGPTAAEKAARLDAEWTARMSLVTAADLVGAGWAESVAIELCQLGADVPAPKAAQRDVAQVLDEEIGTSAMRAAWREAGVPTLVGWPATWGQVRIAALARGQVRS